MAFVWACPSLRSGRAAPGSRIRARSFVRFAHYGIALARNPAHPSREEALTCIRKPAPSSLLCVLCASVAKSTSDHFLDIHGIDLCRHHLIQQRHVNADTLFIFDADHDAADAL